jgi:hypothetical protein
MHHNTKRIGKLSTQGIKVSFAVKIDTTTDRGRGMAHQYYDRTSYDVMWLVKYENSFRTSREIQCTSIANINQLMPSGNTFGLFSVSHDTHKYTIWPNGEAFYVKTGYGVLLPCVNDHPRKDGLTWTAELL